MVIYENSNNFGYLSTDDQLKGNDTMLCYNYISTKVWSVQHPITAPNIHNWILKNPTGILSYVTALLHVFIQQANIDL